MAGPARAPRFGTRLKPETGPRFILSSLKGLAVVSYSIILLLNTSDVLWLTKALKPIDTRCVVRKVAKRLPTLLTTSIVRTLPTSRPQYTASRHLDRFSTMHLV